MKAEQIKKGFMDRNCDSLLLELYEDEHRLDDQNQRYIGMLEKYIAYYGNDDVQIYNTPGRSEICGNHTDHQHGCVVAAGVNLDAIGAVSVQKDKVSIISDNFFLEDIEIDDLTVKEEEKELLRLWYEESWHAFNSLDIRSAALRLILPVK